MKNPQGRLARWVLRLQPYDFEIRHRAGRIHTYADHPNHPDDPHHPQVEEESRQESEEEESAPETSTLRRSSRSHKPIDRFSSSDYIRRK